VLLNNYDIDWKRMARWNTPAKLLNPRMLNWLYGFIYPIVLIHITFKKYRKAKLYEIAMNYQVCYLESFLNDRFDFTQRRIYIEDAQTVDQVYLYQDEELQPLYLYQDDEDQPVYLYQDGESLGDILYDFVVFVPASTTFDQNEMRAMIATKLCGKHYKIELF
jgi:hypothetical protein